MSHDIYVVKTTDGIELIGKLVKIRNDEVIRVMDPLEIKYRTSALGEIVAVLVQYNSFGKENFIDIFRGALVCMYKTNDEYTKTYEESITSIQEQAANRNSVIETKKRIGHSDSAFESLKTALGIISANSTLH